MVAPDFVDHAPLPGQAPGLDGAKRKWAMYLDAIPDLRVTIEERGALGAAGSAGLDAAARVARHQVRTRPDRLPGIQAPTAPIVFAIEFVSLFFARALFVWFYNVTLYSVLLVAIIHASFDGAINQLSRDVVPASNTARFLIFSSAILLPAATVIIATMGQLGRARETVDTPAAVSDPDM